MAVTWTPYANEASLLTLRNSINAFNSAVSINIDTIETDITSLASGKISEINTGLLFTNGSAVIGGQILTTAYAKVKMVDTTVANHANGHISVNYATDAWTVNTTGLYKIRFSGSMTANNGSLVEFNYNINGSSAMPTVPQFQGRGTSPVAVGNSFVVQLTAGATIYIEAKADSAITMTPIGCGISIEKTHY